MPLKLLWIAAVLAASLAGATPAAAAANALLVSRVAFVDLGDVTRVEIDVSRQVGPRIFLLADPARLVVDLPAASWRLPPGAHAGEGLISGYRYGAFDERTGRFVLDLNAPARVRQAKFEAKAPGRPPTLILEVERIASQAFAALVHPPDRPLPPVPTAVTAALANGPAPAPVTAEPPPAAAPAVKMAVPAAAPGRPQSELPVVAAAPAPRPPRPAARSAYRPMIVLDPGHGGVDPGAIGAGGTLEKDITLATAREFSRQLEATGRYRVVLTRNSDVFMRLRERFARAREADADLFISIHADTMPNAGIRGATVYTLSENASDAEAAALAQRENRADIIAGVDLTRENREVVNILIDLAQRETMNSAALFAAALVTQLDREHLLLPAKPHRFAGFAVLKAPDVPSVLLELGYLSNRENETLLNQQRHRARMAEAVVRAADAYFAKRPQTAKN